ncbi:MAG: HD domain-containing phosphohydrolase [Candidatus Susulua stagnicola]|nr:HD domain-containing phosphohydrolase [Candidatus Susulua stagnicola]
MSFLKKKKNFCLDINDNNTLHLGLFQYCLTPEGEIILSNPALAKILGYPFEKGFIREQFCNLFVKHLDRELFLKILNRNKSVKAFEVALKKKNGQPLWVTITANLVPLSGKKERWIEGLIQDISTQKKIADKLTMERNFFENLLDNIPDAIYFKDCENRIIKANNFYIQGSGLKAEDVIGKTDFDFFSPKQAKSMFDDDSQVLNTGKPIIGKIEKTLLGNGRWNQVITTKIPMRNNFGKIIGTMGITRDMTAYANFEQQRLNMMISALEVLGKALEMRDPYTFSHTRNVAGIAEAIAAVLGWDENQILAIKLAGELHDLGKISIPLDILNKPGKLNSLEYRLIQEHVQNCYNLIKDIEFPFPLASIIYQHHERLDGSGYPQGLKGDEIVLEARILAVSDVLEAMTHRRPYREAKGLAKACKELEDGKNTKYDAQIVNIAIDLTNKKGKKEFWIND